MPVINVHLEISCYTVVDFTWYCTDTNSDRNIIVNYACTYCCVSVYIFILSVLFKKPFMWIQRWRFLLKRYNANKYVKIYSSRNNKESSRPEFYWSVAWCEPGRSQEHLRSKSFQQAVKGCTSKLMQKPSCQHVITVNVCRFTIPVVISSQLLWPGKKASVLLLVWTSTSLDVFFLRHLNTRARKLQHLGHIVKNTNMYQRKSARNKEAQVGGGYRQSCLQQ